MVSTAPGYASDELTAIGNRTIVDRALAQRTVLFGKLWGSVLGVRPLRLWDS